MKRILFFLQGIVLLLPVFLWQLITVRSIKLAIALFMVLLFGSAFFRIIENRYRNWEGSTVSTAAMSLFFQLICLAFLVYYSHQIWLLLGR